MEQPGKNDVVFEKVFLKARKPIAFIETWDFKLGIIVYLAYVGGNSSRKIKEMVGGEISHTKINELRQKGQEYFREVFPLMMLIWEDLKKNIGK